MDAKEAMRIFAAEVRRKQGSEADQGEGGDQTELVALRQRVQRLEARLAKPKAATPAPPKFDARTATAAEMQEWRRARGLPDDPAVEWRDPPPAKHSPNADALQALEQNRAQLQRNQQARVAELALDAIDHNSASKTQRLRRLAQLGVVDVEVLAAVTERDAPQPVQDVGGPQRDRLEKARREVFNAERIARNFQQPVDLDDLSPLALQLYREQRGWSPSDVEVLGGGSS